MSWAVGSFVESTEFLISRPVAADPEPCLAWAPTSGDGILVIASALVGMIVQLASILIQSLATAITGRFVLSFFRRGHFGKSFLGDVVLIMAVIMFLLTSLLAQIGVWALAFVICGALPDFGTALYHSAVNFTTLGYGDIVMPRPWRFLGPLEAANGVLMFGVTASSIFTLQSRLLERRLNIHSE
jgi:hypothetical protein